MNKFAFIGTINSDGSIGLVGEVYSKILALSKISIEKFYIPSGEANQVIKINNDVKSINLLEYGPEILGIEVIEIKNFSDLGINFVENEIDYNKSLDLNENIVNNKESSKNIFEIILEFFVNFFNFS